MLIKPPTVRNHNIEYLDPTGDHTKDSVNMQNAIDRLEAKGGGLLILGSGTFHLSASPLIGTGVFIRGQGRGTILRGYRPSTKGHALIYNKGFDQPGYGGARDFGISHVTVDTPDSNGITFVHAQNVLISHIYGVDAYHHIIDIGGSKNVFCSDVFLTEQSGTAPFQIDALPSGGTSRGWSGTATLAPAYDDTGCDTFYLNRAVITATVRTTTQNWAIHLHKIRGRNIYLSDVTLGNTEVGLYQDAGTFWDNIVLDNIRTENVQYGVYLRSTNQESGFRMTNCTFTGLTMKGLYLGQRKDVRISNSVFRGEMTHDGSAIQLRECADVIIDNVIVEETGNKRTGSAGIRFEGVSGALVNKVIVRNFVSGIRAETYSSTPSTGISYSGLLTPDTDNVAQGSFDEWVTS